ncbi:Trypsin Blo t 3-like [Homarus americanus]|uniref:Trypsin Blo t 3-like n=1 Tax=Homarus americanus TaxID=6706 RepID=A0A8J5N4F0_HOMAM|nr:Trypsin Blo t 3-like [Homarus americanus]
MYAWAWGAVVHRPRLLAAGSWEPPQLGSFIIDGDDATPGEFPHQVSVQRESSLGLIHVCGGTIVSVRFILTAAHCVSGMSHTTVKVVAGVTDLLDPKAQVAQAKHFIHHDSYNSITNSNDILLIKLKEELLLGTLVQTLALPPNGEVVGEGAICTVIGWGAITKSGGVYETLQKVAVPVVSKESCRMSYGEAAVDYNMICAGSSVGDACNGDKGGPLLCSGHLHGVASWGEGCGNAFYPTVYMEVTYFRDWILKYITHN